MQARNTATGVTRSTPSHADGSYVLPGLTPASYEISVRKIGFTPQRREVVVPIGATLALDFSLQAGAVELQAVAVEAAPVVEMRTSEVATNVTQQQIEQLPTPSRNFLDLAALAPGVTVTEDRINSGAGFRTFSAGAQSANAVNLFIDGASLKNDLTGGGVAGQDASRGNPFPRNAIQEYRVVTQNFKAEYQKASSAIITATTRSGGNRWSGNAFLNYQDKSLLALDTFQIRDKNNNPNFEKPDYSRFLGGLSIGGPLIQNRLFFFGSYEGNYQNRANAVNIVPPAGFAALDTVNLSQFNGSIASPFRETLLFGKLTYSLGQHSSLEASYNNRHETDVRDFGGQVASQAAVNYRQNIGIGIVKHSYFSGAWLNEASITFEHFRRNPSPDNPNLPSREFQNGSASGCCAGIGRIGSFLSIQDFTQNRVGFRNDLTYTGFHGAGDHVVKVGASVDRLTYDVIKRNDETPHFFYADTIPRNSNTLAYNYRSPYQMTWQYGNPGLKTNNTQFGAYLQDDWTPAPRLTLNLGVRWDYESHMFNYDYVTPQAVRDTIRLYNSQLFFPIDTLEYFTDGTQRNRYTGAFQPRLGFSYSLDNANRTTVFGGWGIFYDRSLFDISVDETLKLQRPAYTVFFAHPDSTPAANEVAWNPAYLTTDTSVLAPLVQGSPGSLGEVWLLPNNVKLPKSMQWNVGLRHAFGDALVASVAYRNVRSENELVFNWANIKWNNFGTDSSACCDFSQSPFHGFSNILYATNSAGSWYHAVEVQVNVPYRRSGDWGWGAGLAYTNASRQVEGVDFPGDQFAFPGSNVIVKHPANDEKSRVVGNWLVDLPWFETQFSGVLTLGSGPRQDYSGRFDPSHYGPGGFTPPQYGFPLIPGAWAYRNLDLRLRKGFPAFNGGSMALTLDAFNVFNYQNFGCFDTGFNSANLGKANCVVSDPFRLQVGAEYNF